MRLENFVPLPRQIVSDVRNGKLTRNEFLLYAWMRGSLNPYGIVAVSAVSLRDDIFKTASSNYVTKLLLSLRGKRYIYYQLRQGRRGSFEVHMGNLITPDKQYKTLDNLFKRDELTGETPSLMQGEPEVSKTIGNGSHRFVGMKNQLGQQFPMGTDPAVVRGHYNDNETEKENKPSIAKQTFRGNPVGTFLPTSNDTMRCSDIAKELGEKNMDFILSVLKRHGLPFIERCWGIYREQARTKRIDNPPAYFNSIAQEEASLIKGENL